MKDDILWTEKRSACFVADALFDVGPIDGFL